MRSYVLTGLACAGLFVAVSARAQQAPEAISQPVPEVMPFDVPYGTPINLATARKVLAAAEAEAQKRNWKMNCAVVEPTGDLVAFEKMDGAQYASIQIAQEKARTAARFRRSTKIFFDVVKGGNPYVLGFPGMLPSEGGFPLIQAGKLIGAVGCSGGTGNQDATVAMAGTEMVK